jgi:hypothetical protein
MSWLRCCFSGCCVLLVILPGCSGKKDAEHQGGDDTSGKPISATPADFEAAFKKDAAAARDRYRGRVVEITGLVTHAGIGPDGKHYLTLGQNTGCMTPEGAPWTKAAPGQTVKVRGKSPEKSIYPHLMDCEIVEVSGPMPPSFTPEQFAKECTTDLKAARAKYKDKFVQISGEIVEVKFNDIKQSVVTFKTPTPTPRIRIAFSPYQEPLIKPLKKGQEFKAFGQFTELFTGEEEIQLQWGLPLK